MLDAGGSASVDEEIAQAASLASTVGVTSMLSFAVGRTGGPLRLVTISSLDVAGIASRSRRRAEAVTDRRLRGAVAALSSVGAGVATLPPSPTLRYTPLACASGGCETVQTSRYAEYLAGVPVAALGLWCVTSHSPLRRRRGNRSPAPPERCSRCRASPSAPTSCTCRRSSSTPTARRCLASDAVLILLGARDAFSCRAPRCRSSS